MSDPADDYADLDGLIPRTTYGKVDGPPSDRADTLDVIAHADLLDSVLLMWRDRDDTKAQPEIRQAANRAVISIDLLLRALHVIRQGLIDEIRTSDRATADRSDKLLAGVYRTMQAIHDATAAGGEAE
jgi:hypothetical protein